MAKIKIAVTLDRNVLQAVDKRVAQGLYPSRSRAVEEALSLLLQRERAGASMLAALAQLDPEEEVALAEEWLEGEPSFSHRHRGRHNEPAPASGLSSHPSAAEQPLAAPDLILNGLLQLIP